MADREISILSLSSVNTVTDERPIELHLEATSDLGDVTITFNEATARQLLTALRPHFARWGIR